MSFGNTPVTSTQSSLPTNQFPLSSVAVPNHSGGNLTALEGGPASTDGNGNETAPASMYVKDGGNVAQGTTTDGAWSGSGAGTEIAILKKLVAELAATLTVSGTVTANAGTNLNTSTLALESGGHLATIDTSTALLGSTGGKVVQQVAGSAVSTSNPMPTTSGQVGLIAAWGSNPTTTGSATDAAFKWGSGGTTTVQRVIISNETGADVRYEFDAAATANSLRLKDGNVIFVAQPTAAVHFFTASSQNINQAGGVMIRGYN